MENEVFESIKKTFSIERFKNGKFILRLMNDDVVQLTYSLSLDELKELRSLLNEVYMSLMLEENEYKIAHNKHNESKIINYLN